MSDVHLTKRLVDAGADLNRVDFTGHSALIEAAIKGKTSTVEYLIKAGAKLDLLNRANLSAADLALGYGHPHIADMIKEAQDA